MCEWEGPVFVALTFVTAPSFASIVKLLRSLQKKVCEWEGPVFVALTFVTAPTFTSIVKLLRSLPESLPLFLKL